MPSVGRQLKEAREARGLTLRDVQEATKIRLRYLEAIEEGQWDVFPGRVYVRGYIRAYAQFLGLPPEPLLEAWDKSHPEEEDDGAPQRGPEKPLSPSPGAPSPRPSRRPWIWILILALLAAGGWWWMSGERGGAPRDVAAEEPLPPPPAEELPPEETPPPPEETPAVTVEREARGSLIRYRVQGASSLEVVLTFSAPCWVRAEADGQVVEGGRTFQKGQTLTFEAAEAIRLRVGYPPAVTLTIQGEDQGLLADEGSPLNVEILLAPASS
ncbi:MAG: DUF4115 domain-containing protein [Clostridiales bacterium]|nr:DUF4115 domain-containing protein [Clostridiales bacterium]